MPGRPPGWSCGYHHVRGAVHGGHLQRVGGARLTPGPCPLQTGEPLRPYVGSSEKNAHGTNRHIVTPKRNAKNLGKEARAADHDNRDRPDEELV